jgi:hypothetical protein
MKIMTDKTYLTKNGYIASIFSKRLNSFDAIVNNFTVLYDENGEIIACPNEVYLEKENYEIVSEQKNNEVDHGVTLKFKIEFKLKTSTNYYSNKMTPEQIAEFEEASVYKKRLVQHLNEFFHSNKPRCIDENIRIIVEAI